MVRPDPSLRADDSDQNLPWGSWPIVRPVSITRSWTIAVIYAVILLPLTVAPRHSGNVFSRYMTIEAIVERGEMAIERSPLLIPSGSPDIVKFGNHFYSDKPPVLSVLATPVYATLYLFGIRFSGRGSFLVANLAMTWCMAGLASAWTWFWVRRMLQAVPFSAGWADVLTLGLGFATQLFTYAVTFNNHSVAAGLVTSAVALTVLEQSNGRTFWNRGGAGFLAALAATIDLPTGGLILAGLLVIQTIRARSIPWAYLVATLIPLLFHTWFQSRVTGGPWPAEIYPESFLYPGSYWATPEGTWKERGPRFWFALEQVVGPQGWWTMTPVLIVGWVGSVMAMTRRGGPFRAAAWVVAPSVLILVGYYTWGVRRLDFAGSSFGTRHLLAITPLVYVFAVWTLARCSRWWMSALFAVLMGVGMIYAIAGMRDPWSRVEKREAAEPVLHALQRFVPYHPPGVPR